MCAYPRTVDRRDLVVEPDEATPSGRCDQRRRLPVQGADRILQRRFGQISHWQRWEPEQRGDHLVGVVHPGRGPDQIAGKGQQTSTMHAVHPRQPRVAVTLPFLPIDKRRIELRPIAGQQGAIHVQEQERTAANTATYQAPPAQLARITERTFLEAALVIAALAVVAGSADLQQDGDVAIAGRSNSHLLNTHHYQLKYAV